MTKCENCQSPDLVIIGGAVLVGSELFCDIVQCVSCFVLFATITRQLVIKLIDEEEPDVHACAVPFDGGWGLYEEDPALRKEVDND